MSYGLQKRRQGSVQERDDHTPERPRCPANGCPFRPVVDVGMTGKMRCTLHAYAEPEDWPRITEQAQRHEWLGQFIADVQKLANALTKRDTTWQQYAVEFWRGQDEHCAPSEAELRNVSAYLYRMFGELSWRCGVSKNRPAKWADPNKGKPSRFVPGMPRVKEEA